VGQLRALAVIHAVLEDEVSSAMDGCVKKVWSEELRKLPFLQADLAFFMPRNVPDAAATMEAALSVVKTIRLCGSVEPHAILGCLYVFEGTTLGVRAMITEIEQTATRKAIETDDTRGSTSEHRDP
jgi:heme oxygenase